LIRALQLIVSLSILVIVHEFGHFIFSRIFHVRVEKFYMFFNPLFSILRVKNINGFRETPLMILRLNRKRQSSELAGFRLGDTVRFPV